MGWQNWRVGAWVLFVALLLGWVFELAGGRLGSGGVDLPRGVVLVGLPPLFLAIGAVLWLDSREDRS